METTDLFTADHVTRLKHDRNGNPRYVFSFFWLGDTFEEAVQVAREIGGKKYRGKNFGGGIVVQAFNVEK